MGGWLWAIFMPSSVLSRSPRLFHQPRKKCCTFCSTSSAAAHHKESGISAEQIEHVFLHGLPSGKDQKCIVACTCLSKTINSVNWTDPSNNIHWKPNSAWTMQDPVPEYSFQESTRYVWLRTPWWFTPDCFSSVPRQNDTKGSFSCRSAAGCRRVCRTNRCTALLPSEPQHKMLSNSTSYGCKLCSVALLCNALLWVSQSMAFRAWSACKALLASVDAQRASLLCSRLLSRA